MPLLRTLIAIQIIALGLWLGSTLMMGLGAPQIFWTMREYQPLITASQHDHVLLRNDDPQRLAGVIALRLFEKHAIIRYAAVGTVLLTLLLVPWAGGKLSKLQLAALLIALGILLYEQTNLVPQMNDLRADIYNPALPELDRAAARDAFQPLHKSAERAVGTEALFALIILLAAPWQIPVSKQPKDTPIPSDETQA
ncbi:MAG: DUF4149 domain-containing protein [Phycisphaeraceae bacterium]